MVIVFTSLKKFMKNKLRILGALLISMLVFAVACSKDDDPADNDFFVGTYNGTITFNDGSETITDDDGRVTVVKVGDSYNFDFGTGIPNINGVKFQKQDDNTYVSIGDGITGITVTASTLRMLVSNNNGTWTADCTR
jgi:hypothetical protein